RYSRKIASDNTAAMPTTVAWRWRAPATVSPCPRSDGEDGLRTAPSEPDARDRPPDTGDDEGRERRTPSDQPDAEGIRSDARDQQRRDAEARRDREHLERPHAGGEQGQGPPGAEHDEHDQRGTAEQREGQAVRG